MSQKQPDNLETLIALAKAYKEDVNPEAKVEHRTLKDIETFIKDLNIKSGKNLIHNLIIYDLYRSLVKKNYLEVRDFNAAFSYYFPKTIKASNIHYNLMKTHRVGKFNITIKHREECRDKYGIKKSKTKRTTSAI